MSQPEIYVSTDVETDGPIPGINSLLSFASAAYRADKTLLGTFTANLEPLPGATADAPLYARGETIKAGRSMVFVRGTITSGDRIVLSFSGTIKRA